MIIFKGLSLKQVKQVFFGRYESDINPCFFSFLYFYSQVINLNYSYIYLADVANRKSLQLFDQKQKGIYQTFSFYPVFIKKLKYFILGYLQHLRTYQTSRASCSNIGQNWRCLDIFDHTQLYKA